MRRLWLCLGLLLLLCVPSSTDNSYAAYYAASQSCTTQVSINQTASTDVKTFTNYGYLCAVMLVSATGQNVSVAQGTGTVCATSPTALIGGTGVTPSIALAANGGFVLTMGGGMFIKTTLTGQHLCVLQSGTGNVSGVISYLDAP